MEHNTGWSKSVCAPDFCIVIIRCTETFWSLCICGPSVWNWLYVTRLVPRILRCTPVIVCNRVPVLPYVSLTRGTVNHTYSMVQSPSWEANWFAASQEIPRTFHVTRRFITALTSVRHLSLSWTSPIQSIYPHPTSWRAILILSTHLRLGLPSGLFPSGLPTKSLYTLTHTRHMASTSHSSRFYHPHNIGWGIQII